MNESMTRAMVGLISDPRESRSPQTGKILIHGNDTGQNQPGSEAWLCWVAGLAAGHPGPVFSNLHGRAGASLLQVHLGARKADGQG